MALTSEYSRPSGKRPYVRPWALATPVAVLLVCLPLLRPLRHPGQASVDEQLRWATISALVENLHQGGPLARHLAIDARLFVPRSHLIEVGDRLYSDQPPMLAFVLSGPYWVLHKLGYRLSEASVFTPYILTLLGVTLPVAGAAGLIYRMGRIFELRRPWRTALAAAAVFGTGLISYTVVLNPHVPAVVLVLASAGCLIHLGSSENPSRGGGWLILAGLCAALAATIDLSAIIFLLLLPAAIVVLRVPIAMRIGGVFLYLLGAAPMILLHAALTVPLTGNLLPGSMHPELAMHRRPFFAEDLDTPAALASPGSDPDEPGDYWMDDSDTPTAAPTVWQKIERGTSEIVRALIGEHGVLVHFPVVVLGVAGMLAVMHRHWPTTTKVLAASSAIGASVGVIAFALSTYGTATAQFGNRWLIVFLPPLFFWAGAWLRRRHNPLVWSIAGILLAFSVLVSLVGATNPMPIGGYARYTAASALHDFLKSPGPRNGTELADKSTEK